jgi:hypothetical protein
LIQPSKTSQALKRRALNSFTLQHRSYLALWSLILHKGVVRITEPETVFLGLHIDNKLVFLNGDHLISAFKEYLRERTLELSFLIVVKRNKKKIEMVDYIAND